MCMVCLSKKKKNGKYYYYLEERAWINGKSTRLWQKYIGPEDKLKEMSISLSPKKVEYKKMEFGGSAALLHVANKIGLIEVIDQVAGKKREQNLSLGEYMLINIINRCIAPTSKTQLGKWFEQDYLSTVFDIEPEILNAQTYWNHFQRLTEDNIASIEAQLIENVLDSYKLDLSCLLFDPTNFFTFLEEHEDQQLAKFGHSKESRNNLRIVNLSILCTLKSGVPIYHQTYEGNVQDATHFKNVLTTITNRFQQINHEIAEIVLIFDKGNHSPKAFKTIDKTSIPFIASLRNSTQKDLLTLPENELTIIKIPSNGKEVGYYRTERTIYDQPRTVYLLHDFRKQKRSTHIFEANLNKRLLAIEQFLTKLNVKKWRSKEKMEVKLKSLIGNKPYSKIISPQVTGSFGKIQVTIQINEEEKATHLATLGRSIIFTSQTEWKPEDIIQAFRDKYVVEDTFKQLKNPRFLAIRPMYHWTDTCIRAHVFSCVLGLLLLSLIRLELREKKLSLSYNQILTILSELSLTQIYTSSTGPPIYKLNRISALAQQIFKLLKLKVLLPD
jgi:transposase